MGYVKMNCPACGGTVAYAGDKEYFICEYCGTKIIKDKQFVELSGSVTVSGIANTATLLERAFLFLEDNDYESANEYFEKVLDADPKCAKAYIGKLMCQLRVNDLDSLASNNIPLSEYAFYNKAIRFASGDELQQYQSYNQAILDRIHRIKEEKLAEIESIKRQITELQSYLDVNKSQNIKNSAKKILWKILLIISVCCVVFWTIGTIAVFPIIIIDIPFIIWMIFMIRLNVSAKKATQQYDTTKCDLEKAKVSLLEAENSYNNWIQKNRY